MGLNSIMQIFMPKDRIFYSLFEEVADGVARMGVLLKQLVAEPDIDRRAAIASQIEDQEHVNDDFTHKVFTELGRNFITPFDREDIHYLAVHWMIFVIISMRPRKKSISIKLIPMTPGFRKWQTSLYRQLNKSAQLYENCEICGICGK